MSEKRKLGPIRQLSLQTDIRSRPILKKQLSVEQLDAIDEHRPGGRGIESAKNKLSDRPRSVKVAWAECRQSSRDDAVPTRATRFSDPVEVRKCKEHKRPTTAAKLRTQSSLEKDSILYTRQELAERLRKAWKDREENKQNLDIFLTHNVQEKHVDDELEEHDNYYEYEAKRHDAANIKSDEQANNLTNKSVHKAIVKSKSTPSNADFSYIPSTTSCRPKDVRTNISVTIPSVIQNCKPMYQSDSVDKPDIRSSETETNAVVQKDPERKEAKLVKQTSLINKENDNTFKNLPPRPMTAAAKREGFQKRTNTAFNGSLLTTGKDYRPPLTRALSVPVKSDGNKPKFIATKRRLKPARRKEKEDPGNNSEDEFGECHEKGKKGVRCKSAPGGELVTMVSLVSPAGSDTEEVVDQKRPEPKSRNVSPVKSATSTSAEPPKTIQLRKTVKSVSFQQSSIHAVRSFSASFPSRRGSMAAALNSGTSLGSQQALPEREKRAPLETSPTENRGPKRRLVRNNSSGQPVATSFDDDTTSKTEAKPTVVLTKQASVDSPNATSGVTKAAAVVKSDNTTPNSRSEERNVEDEDTTTTTADDDPTTPKFETTKEKECWAMYKKMSEKGLPVAYDTILRGMLTPTEYRSIRKEVISS